MDYVIVGMPAFLNMCAAWWVSHYDLWNSYVVLLTLLSAI